MLTVAQRRCSGFFVLTAFVIMYSLMAVWNDWQSTALAATDRPSALHIPLEIREALTDDPAQADFQLLSGQARQQEPLTVGLPLPEDSGINDISQLSLQGAAAGQFRALKHWPNGNIHWVLVDTLADVAAGGANTSIASK